MSAVLRAVPMAPDSDLVDIPELIEQGRGLYATGGLRRGSLAGWPSVDPLYSVMPGQWTIVTGMPQSGKSEWLDALLVNLAEQELWEFCLYSPENYPVVTHLIKLIEKRVRKPFQEGPNPRMSIEEYEAAALWVATHFFWINPELATPDELIVKGLLARQRNRKFGIVLDPWNTLDHERGNRNETDYLSFILTEVTKLARGNDAHVWLVAHPTKIQKNKDGTRPVPTPYDISGSAHWYNKADNIITVHREQASGSQDVEIHVQKVRFKHIGHSGLATLKYDKVTGRYFEIGHPGIAGEMYMDPERGSTPPLQIQPPLRIRDPGEEG